MRKKIFSVLTVLSLSLTLFAQEGGVVYEDLNRNNIYDKGDKPVAGAVITNGKHSVKSDMAGAYTLPQHDKAKFITLSTPSGYAHTASFYHRIGSATNFDFPLTKVANESRRFIQIADTETYQYATWIDDLKDYISNNDVAFINLTGDICYEKGLDFHGANFTDSNLGTRVVTTIGNHDLVGENGSGEKMFESIFGPVWYSFNVGGVHFVNTAMRGGDRVPGYTLDQMIEWLEGDFALLEEGTPIVIFNHDIVFNNGEYVYKTEKNELDLNKYNLRGWLYGHWHVNSFAEFGNVKVYGTGSPNKGGIDHSPSCFRVLEFDENGVLSSEFKYTSLKNNVVVNSTQTNEIVANIYSSTSQVSSSALKIGKKSYSLTQKSDWAWALNLPNGVGAQRGVLTTRFDDGVVVTSLVDSKNSGLSAELVWAENYVGGNTYMSSPVICGDNVMYATIDDNNSLKCGITAINQKTGDFVWNFTSHNSIRNTFVTDGESVFASDIEGYTYKIDAKTGKLLGEMKLQKGVMPTNNLGIAIDNGVVYSGFGPRFSAIDADSFTTLWTADSNGSGEGTNLTIKVVDDIVYTGSYWGARYANDVKTGEMLWKESGNGTRFCASSVTPYGGKLYYTSSSNIHEVDPRTGKLLRLVNSGFQLATSSQPIVTDKLIIVGTADEGVVAFSRETLQLVWNFKTTPALVYTVAYSQNYEKTVESSIVLKDDVLYFGASDGYLYAINYCDGAFKWKYNIGSPILSGVTIDPDNNLYVNDFGGSLYKFRLNLR